MRISDWSSDVCSSDLPHPALRASLSRRRERGWDRAFAGMTSYFFAKFAHNDVTASNRRHSRESGNPVTSAPPAATHCRSTMHRPRQQKRSEEHTSELQSLMRISYAVFCLKKKKKHTTTKSN